ncbi:MAG: cytochrome c biogenesis protein ResB, partial [Akkermansiaceae bacterium]|nr:cytochrome c biogenesis protein ResB [Akkermansiaceae bacterium]
MPATLKPSPAPVPKRSLAEPPPPPKPPFPRRVLNFLSGFACACILLVMLGLLTWLATLEMKDAGLHATLRKYFDSGPQAVFVVPRLFGESLPIVLLGGYWTCVLLFVNLALGGILRMRKGPKQAGVLIVHASILMLLVAGAVSHHFEERGNMLIPEGGSSNVAEDYHEPTVEIVEIIDGQPAAVHVIRGRHFTDLEPGSKLPFRTIRLPNLPFDLDLGGYLSNADIEIAALKPAGPDRLVFDGYYPVEKPDELHAEQNTPATIGRVVRRDGKRDEPFLLHARAFHPFTVRDGDRAFTVSLRKRQWVMPFIVTLDKFTAEFYPGTNKPAAFASDITRTGDGPAVKARIEMNEPMRIHGLTFYQASYSQMGRGPEARMASVFEVVSNPADQWPRYSTFVLAFGLLVHFSIRLAPAFRALFRRGDDDSRKPAEVGGPPPVPVTREGQPDKLPRGRLVAAALVLVALAGIALTALYQSTPRGGPPQIAGYERWQPEITALAATLPVQDGGRIKPLSARASFTLYALHGSRSLRVKDAMGKSHSLSPTEWMLDTLFRPDLAVHQPVFRVDNSAVLAAIG